MSCARSIKLTRPAGAYVPFGEMIWLPDTEHAKGIVDGRFAIHPQRHVDFVATTIVPASLSPTHSQAAKTIICSIRKIVLEKEKRAITYQTDSNALLQYLQIFASA